MPLFQLKYPEGIKGDGPLPMVNVPCSSRALIYNNQLLALYTELNNLPEASSSNFMMAIKNHNLLDQLAAILDQYVASGMAADFQKCRSKLYSKSPSNFWLSRQPILMANKFFTGNNEEPLQDEDKNGVTDQQAYINYFKWVIESRVGVENSEDTSGVKAFFQRNPRTQYVLNQTTLYFFKNLKELVSRLKNDWNLVSNVFFQNPKNLKLVNVESTGADFHRGGRQVLILTFLSSAGLHKLVYKPTDLEVDCYLVGKIQGLDQPSKSLLQTQLAADKVSTFPVGITINKDRPNYFVVDQSMSEMLNAGADQAVSLPTYKILPRFSGSFFKTNTQAGADPAIPVKEAYGYIEFLTHEDADYKNTSEEERQSFFTIWGKLIAMASVFSIMDLHNKNVIVHNKKPHLIDLEGSFCDPFNSVGDTSIFSRVDPGQEHNADGHGGIDGSYYGADHGYEIRNDQSGAFSTSSRFHCKKITASNNRIINTNGKACSVFEPTAKLNVAVAFVRTLEAMLSLPVNDWLDKVKICTTRCFVSPIKLDRSSMEVLCSKVCASMPLTANGLDKEDAVKRILENQGYKELFTRVPQLPITWTNLNSSLLWAKGNSLLDYANCDLPIYAHRLDDANIYNSGGKLVNAAANRFSSDSVTNTGTYLPESSYAAVLRQVNKLEENHLGASLGEKLRYDAGSIQLLKERKLRRSQ